MLRRIGLVVVALVLASPATALGGGFATVGLQSLPEGIEPGEPWIAKFTVLAHGRTPVPDLEPSVTVRSANGTVVGSFRGRSVNEAGLYRARVVFPERGRYEYVIDDGYSQRHTYPPVTIGAGDSEPAPASAPAEPAAPQPVAQAPSGDGSSVPLALALAAGAGLLAAWLTLMLLSRRRPAGGEPALDA